MNTEIKKEFDKVWKAINEVRGVKPEKHAKLNSGKTSITQLIIELKNQGFFEPPKNSEEIRKALAANAHHYAASSLTWPLQDLVKKRVLGRLPEGKGWKYAAR